MTMENMKQAQPAETGEKTFTQEEVNAIIGKRLAEQKAAAGKELADREAELNQREMELRAKELLKEKGLPKELAGVLKYDDEESLMEAMELIEKASRSKIEKYVPLENRLPQSSSYGIQKDPIREVFTQTKG